MRQKLRFFINFLGSLYYRARALPFVWRFLNREGRKKFLLAGVTLTRAEERILSDLCSHGIASADISELFPAEVFSELKTWALGRWQNPDMVEEVRLHEDVLRGEKPKGRIKKAFLVNLWPFDSAQGRETDTARPLLDVSHPFIRFSLSEPVLRVAMAYLGQFTKFRAWRLEATIPMPDGVRAQSSQRWHRDEEDVRLIKVFLYLTDVDENSGPFMYVKNSQKGSRGEHMFPAVPPRGSLSMPKNEDDFIPKADVVSMYGKAGTVIFCDTSGLHKGGFALREARLMYTSAYTTSASLWPIRYRYPAYFQPEGLTLAQRFALENDQNQKEPKYYL